MSEMASLADGDTFSLSDEEEGRGVVKEGSELDSMIKALKQQRLKIDEKIRALEIARSIMRP